MFSPSCWFICGISVLFLSLYGLSWGMSIEIQMVFFILAPRPLEDHLKSVYQVPYRPGEYRQKGKTSPSSDSS